MPQYLARDHVPNPRWINRINKDAACRKLDSNNPKQAEVEEAGSDGQRSARKPTEKK